MQPTDVRAYGSERVIATTPDGSFVGRFDTTTLADSSVLALFIEEGGDPDEPLALDIESIMEIRRAQ